MKKPDVSWGFRDKDHPIWGILKIVITTSCVGVLLAFNATNFDGGEVRTILGTGALASMLEGINLRRRS